MQDNDRNQTMTQPLVFHQFIPGTGVPLMLLHGSGGDERDLIPLAAELAPGTPALGIRGAVEIDGGFAFFHRRPDRSIDEADIGARIPPLAAFIEAAGAEHGLAKPPVIIGFSNGAIMAAALLLTHPALFSAGILFRPLSPFLEDRPDRLGAKPILIIDGEKDSRRSPGDGARLAERLTRAGATVTHHVLHVGHAITGQDRRIARDWLSELR
jgi:phospholipase/carboxylesterase